MEYPAAALLPWDVHIQKKVICLFLHIRVSEAGIAGCGFHVFYTGQPWAVGREEFII